MMVTNRDGFTLIELMMVVAIIGILAAIAIPAYLNYSKKVRTSGVLNVFDVLAQSVCEYHAVAGCFPAASYGANNLASFRQRYAVITVENSTADDGLLNFAANFTTLLDLTAAAGDEGILRLEVNYDPAHGYRKTWAATSTVDDKFIPRM